MRSLDLFAAEVKPGLKPEDPHRVAAAHGVALRRRQRIHAREAALHVADVVRVVGAVEDVARRRRP